MDITQARKIGRQVTLEWTLYAFLVGELVFLVQETRGDFANGILFFIEGRMSIHYLAGVIILFTITYFLGQRNGKEILILNRNYFITTFKYGLLAIWVALAYGHVASIVKTGNETIGAKEIVKTYILEPYVEATLYLIVPIAIYSYFCGNRIKRSKIELEGNN